MDVATLPRHVTSCHVMSCQVTLCMLTLVVRRVCTLVRARFSPNEPRASSPERPCMRGGRVGGSVIYPRDQSGATGVCVGVSRVGGDTLFVGGVWVVVLLVCRVVSCIASCLPYFLAAYSQRFFHSGGLSSSSRHLSSALQLVRVAPCHSRTLPHSRAHLRGNPLAAPTNHPSSTSF